MCEISAIEMIVRYALACRDWKELNYKVTKTLSKPFDSVSVSAVGDLVVQLLPVTTS